METSIVAVTVYPGQARITRRGRVKLVSGQHEVRVGGLPLRLRPDSVRANGRGPATILGVDVVAEHHPHSPDTTVNELDRRRQALLATLDELADLDTVTTTKAELINSLARRSGTALAGALAAGSADPARVTVINDALADQLGAVLATSREVAARRQTAQQDLDEVNRRLGDLAAARAPDRRTVSLSLEVTLNEAELELEVSYLVDDARWDSRYDIRLHDDELTLIWYGLITQHSGEDWPECDLRLSTARPASAVTVPELSPWYVGRAEIPRPVGTYRGALPGRSAAMSAPMVDAEAATADVVLATATATAEHRAAATVYQPTRRVAVPSDGTAHRTTITVAELPTRLDHVTVPLRGPEAYLRATTVNTSEHTMRPGEASIFHDSEFVGTTTLEPWAPGEEVELALGVDDRVRVERELVRRSAGKAVLGGTQRHEAAYRITVGNYGPREANLTVIDQVPVSRDESIVVRDVVCEPRPAEQTDLGELTWRLALEPGQAAQITMAFRVDVAKGVRLDGWRD